MSIFLCACVFICSIAVTVMGYITQAQHSPAWSAPLCSGHSKMFVNGWRNTVLTTICPTWRRSPSMPSQVIVHLQCLGRGLAAWQWRWFLSPALSCYRSCVIATEWGEAGEDGLSARDASTGASATGAAAPGAGGGTQPAAPQQRWTSAVHQTSAVFTHALQLWDAEELWHRVRMQMLAEFAWDSLWRYSSQLPSKISETSEWYVWM